MADISYTDLMASLTREGDGYAAVIPETWMQGRATYGGLCAALCLECAMRTFPDLAPLRSVQIGFVGPAGGRVLLSARILRQGKSVAFVEADLIGEKGVATRALFAFGAHRPSDHDQSDMPAPEGIPAPDACERFLPDGVGPAFFDKFDARLVRGGRPFVGPRTHDHLLWVRHADPQARGVTALLAAADAPPPAIAALLSAPARFSSMTWFVNLLDDNVDAGDGWRLLQTRAEASRGGYSSQDMLVWTRDGAPVIAGRQSVAYFA